MGLLDTLQLKPTRAMLARGIGTGVPVGPAVAKGGLPAGAAGPARGAVAGAPAAPSVRAAAAALRPQLAQRLQAARGHWQDLSDLDARLAQALRAGKGDLAKLKTEKEKIAQRLATADRLLELLEKDVATLDDPGAGGDRFAAILARHRSGATVAPAAERSDNAAQLGNWTGDTSATIVTASYRNGKAVSQRDEATRTLGADGYRDTQRQVREETSASGTQRATREQSTTLDASGLTLKQARKLERESADGRSSSVAKEQTTQVTTTSLTRTEQVAVKRADGSGSTTARSAGLEREGGKLGLTAGRSTTTTDAHENERTRDAKAKGGLIAGKDGLGGYAEAEGGLDRKRASGVTTGVVGGLATQVVCNIVQVGNSDPARYKVSLSMDLGASVGVSAGHDKEKAPAKGKARLSAAAKVFMKREYLLDAAETQRYVKALELASAGNPAGGDLKEFAVIAASVSRGPEAARDLWLAAGGQATGADATAKLKAGESVTVGSRTEVGAAVGADARGIGLELGAKASRGGSTTVTREANQDLTYEVERNESTELSAKVSASAGLVKASLGGSSTKATSTGYRIVVPHDAKNARRMQDELDRCSSQADLDAFAKKYPQAVAEKVRTEASAETESQGLGIGVVEAGIRSSSGIESSTRTDGAGKLLSRKVVGKAGRGGEAGLLGVTVGDSAEERAVAEVDAQGNARLDLSRETTSSNLLGRLRKKLPFMADEPKEAAGSLTRLTGGAEEEDTDTHHLQGLALGNGDLDRLGRLAGNEEDWLHACLHARYRPDWRKAGAAIRSAGGSRAAVAEQIAIYLGSDKSNRLRVLMNYLRPAGSVGAGSAIEFPDGLQKWEAPYRKLVLDQPAAGLAGLAQEKGPDAAVQSAREMLGQLDKLQAAIAAAPNYARDEVRAEMLAALNASRLALRSAAASLGGAQPDAAAPDSPQQQAFASYTDTCRGHQKAWGGLVKKFEEARHSARIIVRHDAYEPLQTLYALWSRDYERLLAAARAAGRSAADCAALLPPAAEMDRFGRQWQQSA